MADRNPHPQPAGMFDDIPGVTAAVITILTAGGAGHRYTIEMPEGAAVRIDQNHDLHLPDLDLGPAPPVIPRAYPMQIAFAFAIPLHREGARATYTAHPAPRPPQAWADATAQTGQNLALAVMERQAIMNRLRDLCQERQHGEDTAALAADALAILDDPDPLGHP